MDNLLIFLAVVILPLTAAFMLWYLHDLCKLHGLQIECLELRIERLSAVLEILDSKVSLNKRD